MASAISLVSRDWTFAASLPERTVRAGAALAGGTVYELAQVVLPRALRRSRLYEATAKNVLRIAIELVGGVEADAAAKDPAAPPARELALRKGAGNVVELGSIAAFGFSPLWLLAGASDLVHGSRVYLAALVEELKEQGIVRPEVEVSSVDDLLGTLERSSGKTAALIDIPPVELAGLRKSFAELRHEADSLPSAQQLAELYDGLRRAADLQGRSLLEVSSGVGLAALSSARELSRDHLVKPYREDWQPVRRQGLAAYARRRALPYRRAVSAQFDRGRKSYTERLLGRLAR